MNLIDGVLILQSLVLWSRLRLEARNWNSFDHARICTDQIYMAFWPLIPIFSVRRDFRSYLLFIKLQKYYFYYIINSECRISKALWIEIGLKMFYFTLIRQIRNFEIDLSLFLNPYRKFLFINLINIGPGGAGILLI